MTKPKEIKSKVKKDGEFVPPDGGWGWAIVFAAGFSNLCALPILQQFGLLFRDKFERLGISSSQTTTIINMNSALTSCVGLANGPVFKTFTYRKVSFTGATLVFISLMLTTFSYNFITYLISFSILYGAGFGISSSANALALNTYWKNRRRLATGLSWTTTGLGPILWPHIITALFYAFGETGAILIISGISLHSIAFALLLQPVEWHVKKTPPKEIEEEAQLIKPEIIINGTSQISVKKIENGYFSSKLKNLSAFSSQYLYNEDDPTNPGYEITDPGVPMMLRANDGYFSQSRQSRSRVSSRDGSTKTSRLNSKKPSMTNLLENRSRKSSTLYLNESKKNSSANLGSLVQERETLKPKRKTSLTLETKIAESEIEDCPTLKAPQDLKTEEKERNLLENRSRKSSTLYLNESKKNSSTNLGALGQERDTYKPKRKTSITLETHIPESEIEDYPTLKAPQDLKADEKAVVEKINPTEAKNIDERAEMHITTGLKTNKSTKSFKMDGLYGEKYNKDNHSNISLKNQYGDKYQRDNHSNISLKNQYYGEKYNKDNHSNISFKNQEDYDEKKYLKDNLSNQSMRTKQRRKSNNFNNENEVLKQASMKLEQYLKEKEDDKNQKMKLLLEKISDTDEEDDVFEKNQNKTITEGQRDEDEELTFCQKVVLFFDLDLLKDFTFINLMLGITLANFNELNFSILTPFILGDYGKTKPEVALFMSLLAGIDICVRFCIPFVAGKIGWDNNSFFLFGVMSMAMGRVVLAYSQESWVVILVAVMIGFGKGLRTVFMALVIPTHVPLHKLPGATGIQLLTAGIAYLSLGPLVGWVKDNASTAVTLHCLNIFTWMTAISWGLEKYIRSRRQGNSEEKLVNA